MEKARDQPDGTFPSFEAVLTASTIRTMSWAETTPSTDHPDPLVPVGDGYFPTATATTEERATGRVRDREARQQERRHPDPAHHRDVDGPDPSDQPGRTGEFESGGTVTDPDGYLAQRLLLAFWRLCDQTITVSTTEQVTRGTGTARRQASHPAEEVRVVHLRHQQHPTDDPRRAGPVPWTHRWIVSMHRRRQWYPSQHTHKIIFVGPYVKGPADLPLRPAAEAVHALVR